MILKTYKIIYNKGKTARPRVELGPSVPSLAKNARAYPTKKLKIMHQSIPPAPSTTPPPSPGYCGAFACLVSPGGGAFANFVLPGGRAFANPRAIPELLTRTRFAIQGKKKC